MDTSQLIRLYSTGFYVSLGIAVVGLLLAILFFILFKIPSVIALETGHAKKKEISEMERSGNLTGALKDEIYNPEMTSGDLARSGHLTGGTGSTQPAAPYQPDTVSGGRNAGAAETTLLEDDARATTVLSADTAGTSLLNSNETQLLKENGMETSVLKPSTAASGPAETSVLSGNAPNQMSGMTMPLNTESVFASPSVKGKFEITENTILIHTDEVI